MKKSIFILLLLAVTISIQAQSYGEFAAYKVALQLDAYEHSNGVTSSGEFRSHTLIVDDFYDVHLIKSKINRLVDEYSDIIYVDLWRWDPDIEYFTTVLNFDGLELFLGYSETKQACIVLYDKIKGDKIIE